MKNEHKTAIRKRAEEAIRDLYHNATVNYPRINDDAESKRFESWFQSAAEFEIEYIQDGGASPGDYRKTLSAPCNAGKYKSERARKYYIRKGLRDQRLERADCGIMTGWRVLELAAGNKETRRVFNQHYAKHYPAGTSYARMRNNALWERAREYGKIYTYGCGGRTLAPCDLYDDRRRAKWDPEEHSIADCVELIRIVESFNRYVRAWCHSVPEQWAENESERIATEKREKAQRAARKAKETKERNYWNARDVVTSAL